ncbi:hypothetical protein B0H66DRAFT_225728 [Apodospora peruviana]|uniref:Uncharacterized protein n=1 Tax=Apodospora peruviana TaxID=516989 RepID=A0AAE0I3V6_9PEZI|nr:hypothetical protein B0H66DRAFT_225728 [Apodospora peruviana]
MSFTAHLLNPSNPSTPLKSFTEFHILPRMASTTDPEGSILSRDTTTTSSFTLEEHTRKPQPSEPTHKGKNRLFYFAYCSWSGQSTTNIRQHLLCKHDIALEAAIRTAEITIG